MDPCCRCGFNFCQTARHYETIFHRNTNGGSISNISARDWKFGSDFVSMSPTSMWSSLLSSSASATTTFSECCFHLLWFQICTAFSCSSIRQQMDGVISSGIEENTVAFSRLDSNFFLYNAFQSFTSLQSSHRD